jgi:hypothetical protein
MGISFEKFQEIAPDLSSSYQKAGFAANKYGLEGEAAAVYLVLDRSGSMRDYYADDDVQYFSERILGMAAHFEDDGKVPVVFFDDGLKGTDELDLRDYKGKIGRAHKKLGRMGGTNYDVAMDAVVRHYQASGKTVPALVIFQTDGSPQNRQAAVDRICQYARLPLFWQFVGFGEDREYDEDDEYGLGFLQRLDDIPVPAKRPIDNSDFFAVGEDPREMRDSVLYNRLMSEFPGWLTQARSMGILV